MNNKEELSQLVLLYRASARVWVTIVLAVLLGPIGNLANCARLRSARLLGYLILATLAGSTLDSLVPIEKDTYHFSVAGQLTIAALACGASVNARNRLGVTDQEARDSIAAGCIR